MTEEASPIPPGTEPDAAAPVLDAPLPPPPPPPPRRQPPTLVPWVFALAFIVLGWAVMFLWLHPATTSGPSPEAQRVDTLAQQVQTLDVETKQLASRPVAQPQALAAVQARLADLAARKPPAPDLSALEGRLTALERQKAAPPAVDLAPLQQKLAGVEQQVAGLASVRGQLEKLDHDQQALVAQVQGLTAGAKNADSGLGGRIDEQGKAIDALRGEVGRIDASLGRTTQAARAEAALSALQAGRPLGTVPGAPPAVARFATEPPPTAASLRRAFPEVAQAALAASRPDDADKHFLDRVWTRAQNLVTVRQGDHVLVGDPAAGVIARARDDLDAADVAGAVDALSTLTGPPAQAVAGWLGSARALLEARAALIGMAGQH
ncbi:MAG: hypothetical protein ABI224_14675 [Acetobacteraceae bacterium]